MKNSKSNNNIGPQVTENIARWHHDRNLIHGASTWTQSKKLLEEYIEMIAAQMPGESPDAIALQVAQWTKELLDDGRIKTVHELDARNALIDSIGDQGVVAINICEREGIPYAYALHESYMEIKDRKGKMVEGTFVKEEDLNE